MAVEGEKIVDLWVALAGSGESNRQERKLLKLS